MHLITSIHLFIFSLYYSLEIEMSLKNARFKSRWQKNQWVILALTLLVALLLIPLPGNTKDKTSDRHRNRLPPAPDTGSPEEDFSAGGTRDNRYKDTICSIDRQQFAYLLGNRNREFTLSAYPTFWFHVPNTTNKTTQIKFVLTELETGKKIYERSLSKKESGIVGITLPQKQKYALSPETNYAWSLEADCSQNGKKIALEGWLSRASSSSRLQDRLAATPEAEKYKIYFQHNLLYDALTQLARRRMAKPDNPQIEMAWSQLLTELGWQDLIQQESATEPFIIDTRISSQKN